MDPSDIAFVKGIVAFIALAAVSYTGVGLWLRERRRGALPANDELVKSLREENARHQELLESRLTELEERLRFTEKLLTKEPAPAPLRSADEHPPR